MATRSVPPRRTKPQRGTKTRLEAEKELLDLMPDNPDPKVKRRSREDTVPRGEAIRVQAARGADNDRRPRDTIHLGKRWTEILRSVKAKEYTWEEFCDSLDPEELARGQLKDKNGRFVGAPPVLIPRQFFTACQRELKRRFDEKLQSRVLEAVDEYIALSKTTEDDNTKEKMLRYLMERVFGPVPKEVKVSQGDPWETVVTSIVATEDQAGAASKAHPYADRIRDRKKEDR